MLLLSACASNPQSNVAAAENESTAVADEDSFGAELDEDASPSTPKKEDRFESFNRAVFSFNMTADRWLIKPVAKGYDFILPDPVQSGIGNFWGNLKEVSNVVNDGLQWKWKQAANDSGRFLINSTVGVLGFFDVARKMGLEKNEGENFTQTLAAWGVPRGPYLVLPILGSNTVRGTISLPVEWKLSPTSYINNFEARMGAKALEQLHVRTELLGTEELATGDFYVFVREAYMQRLKYLENDGKVEDSFGDDFGDDDYDF
ncbi:putative phospholipid-binding lipoprotein MlaA [Thalassocella blandensis]|nr:putative phospholipid-binding lipoprotein MlaA [Thalassocella blandensis]